MAKTVKIQLRQGVGVLGPDPENPGELVHMGSHDEDGKHLTYDVPVAFAIGLVADGRATLAGADADMTTTDLALAARDDTPETRAPRSRRGG